MAVWEEAKAAGIADLSNAEASQGLKTALERGAVAAVEAFEDAGKPYPVFMGEDEVSFLRTWKESDLTAIALAD